MISGESKSKGHDDDHKRKDREKYKGQKQVVVDPNDKTTKVNICHLSHILSHP